MGKKKNYNEPKEPFKKKGTKTATHTAKLPDYKAVEQFASTKKGKQLAARERAQLARDAAKRYNYRKVTIRQVDPKTMPKPKPGRGVNKLGNVTEATQGISTKGSFKELKGAGVPKSKPTSNYTVKPVYKGDSGTSKYIGTKVTNIKTGKSVFTPKGKITQTGAKSAAKVVGKTIAKGATKLIPGIGTAMIAKDVYDLYKWAEKQPKKSSKPYKYGNNY